jgi:hypothetical protein
MEGKKGVKICGLGMRRLGEYKNSRVHMGWKQREKVAT